MDVYDLINSKDIGKYCREIKHKFNTEEIAVLIYRNKNLNLDKKIELYQELIKDYPDMEVIERINCKHYNSVKDMIKGEIERIISLREKLIEEETNAVYTYVGYWNGYGRMIEDRYNDMCNSFEQIIQIIEDEIKEDDENEYFSYRVIKRDISGNKKYKIVAEYKINQLRKLEMVNIYNFVGDWLDISNICLNIPTPFKRGDILMAHSTSPFSEGHILSYEEFPFVLEDLNTWDEHFIKTLADGNHDSSDINGVGYMVSEEDRLYADHVFDYDDWEYFNGKLEGMARILKGTSNLMKDKIGIELFVKAYELIKMEERKNNLYLNSFTEEGLKLAGFNEEDMKKMK